MNFSISRIFGAIPPQILRALTLRFDRSPFDTVDKLIEFVQTRAAYVAQTSLYGYLKTRMGTRYRVMFEDDIYAGSINFAKWRIYASCLSDLAVFAAATTRDRSGLSQTEAAELARYCFENAVKNTFHEAEDPDLESQIIENFSRRLDAVDWTSAGEGENAFGQSPVDLIKWAPVVDEFKDLDSEIVINSTRFRWRDVRDQLRKRIDASAIAAEWGQMRPPGNAATADP